MEFVFSITGILLTTDFYDYRMSLNMTNPNQGFVVSQILGVLLTMIDTAGLAWMNMSEAIKSEALKISDHLKVSIHGVHAGFSRSSLDHLIDSAFSLTFRIG